MKNITTQEFKNDLELQGILIDEKNQLNIGFMYENHTFIQTASFQLEKENLVFENKIIMHLNSAGIENPCPFCNAKAEHLVRCEALENSELPFVVIDAALEKIETENVN
ncbi:hypothetical protein [Bacillus cereus]